MYNPKTDSHVDCTFCGRPPTERGHDACIANLPGVTAACCGHGKTEGYIYFEDGQIIRGWFDHIAKIKFPERFVFTDALPR